MTGPSATTRTTGGIVTLGETMLLLTGDGVGPVVDLERVRLDTGGAESNVAIGVARAGVPARWIGRVGADPAGERVVADIASQGVDVIAIEDPAHATGIMMKERLADGRTRVTYHRRGSAGAALTRDDVPPGVVEAADVLHVTGITLAISTSARLATLDAVRRARAAGVAVSFDVNHRPKLIDERTARDAYREVVRHADVVFAGDDEARLLLDVPERPDDEEFLARGLAAMARGTAVVKLGSRGAVAVVDGELLHRGPTPVVVVDPVGAGDAFVAAWLAATIDDDPPARRLDRAADAGALACTVEGDWHEPVDLAELPEVTADDVAAAVHDRVDR